MDLKTLLHTYLSDNKLMQLATVENGHPWLCNVYFVSDSQNNIYWTSARSRRHSKEIKSNPNVAATIVHDSVHKQALQITGDAHEVTPNDLERVDKLYAEKFGYKPARLVEVLENKFDGRAYWILEPISMTFWDEFNFPDSPKQEIIL